MNHKTQEKTVILQALYSKEIRPVMIYNTDGNTITLSPDTIMMNQVVKHICLENT